MPYVPNANINAPTLMLAEKAADLIIKNTPLPKQAQKFYRAWSKLIVNLIIDYEKNLVHWSMQLRTPRSAPVLPDTKQMNQSKTYSHSFRIFLVGCSDLKTFNLYSRPPTPVILCGAKYWSRRIHTQKNIFTHFSSVLTRWNLKGDDSSCFYNVCDS